MANERRLIEVPADGIIRAPIMSGESTVGERCIDLRELPTVEVMRCRDCAYLYGVTPWCGAWSAETEEDGFCFRFRREKGK